MDPLFITLMFIGLGIVFAGGIVSFIMAKKQKSQMFRKEKAMAEHLVMMNPEILFYIFTLIAVAIGSTLFYWIFFKE